MELWIASDEWAWPWFDWNDRQRKLQGRIKEIFFILGTNWSF